MPIDPLEPNLVEKVIRLQEGLVAFATGGGFDGGDEAYARLRRELIDKIDLRTKLPDFVRQYRDLFQFWQFIKHKLPTYKEAPHSHLGRLPATDRTS